MCVRVYVAVQKQGNGGWKLVVALCLHCWAAYFFVCARCLDNVVVCLGLVDFRIFCLVFVVRPQVSCNFGREDKGKDKPKDRKKK